MKFAIIGAGISGLSVAKSLSQNGFEVEVFEKARGVGGRMSTRRTENHKFDHGAQCFTARTKEFQEFLKPFQEQGVIKDWTGKVISLEDGKKQEKRIWFEPHLVACPNMNSLCKGMAEGLINGVNTSSEIHELRREEKKWSLITKDKKTFTNFDCIISTAPPKQTVDLFPKYFEYSKNLQNIEMYPCYALMVGFKEEIKIPWIGAKTRNSILKWITIGNSRPDRENNGTSILIHSSNNWSNKNKHRDIETLKVEMLSEFEKLTGISTSNATHINIHRWLYSIVEKTEKAGSYYDKNNGLGACGDWCLTSRIEEAWLSGQNLVEKILKS